MASIFSKFFGRTVSEAAGFAAGLATGPVLAPVVQDVVNETWALHPDKRVDPLVAAQIVAEDVEQRDWGAGESAAHGVDGTRFDALLGEALNAPTLGTLFELWRRQLISDGDFVHGLRKAKLEPRWDSHLEGLHDVLLSSQELAMAQQQGFVDEGRSNSESGLQGVTSERQQIRFQMAGLPPGVETALTMLRRNIIDAGTFAQIVREGHTKTKYTDVLLALEQQRLSAATYVRAFLKGHITRAEMHTGGALWGYTAADMDLWYESQGRPATVRQIHIGYARGARLPGAANEHDAILTAVAQSDIRPEYGELLYAQRYSYTVPLWLRALLQAGVLTEAEGEDLLVKIGNPPDIAAKVAAHFADSSTGASGDSHVGKAQTQLWNRIHTSYLDAEISEQDAASTLPQAGVAAGAIADVLSAWDAERALIRKQLTPTQLRKAMGEGVANPATGQPYTFDEVHALLMARGYSAADATVFLQS